MYKKFRWPVLLVFGAIMVFGGWDAACPDGFEFNLESSTNPVNRPMGGYVEPDRTQSNPAVEPITTTTTIADPVTHQSQEITYEAYAEESELTRDPNAPLPDVMTGEWKTTSE